MSAERIAMCQERDVPRLNAARYPATRARLLAGLGRADDGAVDAEAARRGRAELEA